MANNGDDDEIIEKSSSEPVGNACLILGAIALLGGMIFQIMEISEVRSTLTAQEKGLENPSARKASELTTTFSKSVKDLIEANSHPELKLEGGVAPETSGKDPQQNGEESATDEKAADKDTEKDAQPPTEEKPVEEKPEPDEAKDAPAKDTDAEGSDPK